MSEIISFTFPDTGWHDLTLYPAGVTIKNTSGYPISIVITETGVLPDDLDLQSRGIDPLEIGGLINEITVPVNKFVFGKSVLGLGFVTVRPEGTLDPSEDITYLATVLNNTVNQLGIHEVNNENPHDVNKEQVGLGNIPNDISNDPTINSELHLATTVATSTLHTNIENHKLDLENPHVVTKTQVGLGNVENFNIATPVEARDQTVNNKYMTPKNTYEAVKSWVQVALSMKSQIVIRGQVNSRVVGWSNLDCDLPSRILEKIDNTQIRILSGLQVTFADGGKTRDSLILENDQTLNIPVNPVNGLYYIYCDLSAATQIIDFGMTQMVYKEGMTRDGHIGDFYSVPENVMYSSTNTPIRRVYLGKCYINNGAILSIVPVPIGTNFIFPLTQAMTLGGRYLYDNPFCGPIETIAQVEYNSSWGESGWNDQIGVVAHPYPINPIDSIVVQIGLMGFLASGRDAGSPFGANFNSITTAPRARVVVRKKY